MVANEAAMVDMYSQFGVLDASSDSFIAALPFAAIAEVSAFLYSHRSSYQSFQSGASMVAGCWYRLLIEVEVL